jgi:hypothetical protein
MYPAVRPGDLLVIRSRKAADVRTGDIAVCRRPGYLFGHRVIELGVSEGRPFIVTASDRAESGNDGPTYDDDLLGVVAEIRRRGRPVPFDKRSIPRRLRQLHSARLGLAGSALAVRGRLAKILAGLQKTAAYRRLARLWLGRALRRMDAFVQVPFSASFGDSVFKELPEGEFDPGGDWFGKPIVRWALVLKPGGGRKAAPAARMTFARGEDGRWSRQDVFVRPKFRGLGLDAELEKRASRILSR